jgi:hypothetical protein
MRAMACGTAAVRTAAQAAVSASQGTHWSIAESLSPAHLSYMLLLSATTCQRSERLIAAHMKGS